MALGARQQVKIWKTGQLSRHYIAEISLNVTLNYNQPTLYMYTQLQKKCTTYMLFTVVKNFNQR